MKNFLQILSETLKIVAILAAFSGCLVAVAILPAQTGPASSGIEL